MISKNFLEQNRILNWRKKISKKKIHTKFMWKKMKNEKQSNSNWRYKIKEKMLTYLLKMIPSFIYRFLFLDN